jgi:Cdc6-like AAA superfamily ATPase
MDELDRPFCQWLETFRGRNLTRVELLGLRLGIENHYRSVYHDWYKPEPNINLGLNFKSSNDFYKKCMGQVSQVEVAPEVAFVRSEFFEPQPIQEKKVTVPIPTTPQKRVVVVEHRVECIADILSMIEAYPLIEGVEYSNIDVAPLHQIRDELREIEDMIGLDTLKRSIVDQLLYFIQDLNGERNVGGVGVGVAGGVGATGDYKHIVLFGPPGTGKTEVARLIGRMYSKLGVLKNGVFKKVVRGDLIAGYVGQTAIKTRAVINECLGGVLFIDEAYSLATDDQFSSECIDTLCEALSDHKDDLMVIVAGYEEPMKRVFFKANPGLESRFIWRFKMPGYNAKELRGIFEKKVSHAGWDISSTPLQQWFDDKMKHFAHFGRDMEMLFIYTKVSHSRRIYASSSSSSKRKITIADLDEGFRLFLENSFHEESVSSRTSISMMYI